MPDCLTEFLTEYATWAHSGSTGHKLGRRAVCASGLLISSRPLSLLLTAISRLLHQIPGTPAQAKVVATEAKEGAADGHFMSNAPDFCRTPGQSVNATEEREAADGNPRPLDLSTIPAQTDTCGTTVQNKVDSAWENSTFSEDFAKLQNF